MARIIKRCERKKEVSYALEFVHNQIKGAGFAFPCDKDGNVDMSQLSPAALENYLACVSGKENVTCQGVKKMVRTWIEPAILECDCGAHVELAMFTNTCSNCGTDYNFEGRRLAPREQWGEETGEHWGECYRI